MPMDFRVHRRFFQKAIIKTYFLTFKLFKMKKLIDVKASFSNAEILTAQQARLIKGGKSEDDKRRTRPGGGITTQGGSVKTQ